MSLYWKVSDSRTAIALMRGDRVCGAVEKRNGFFMGYATHHKGNIRLKGFDVDMRLLGAYPSVKAAAACLMDEVNFLHEKGRFRRILEQ